jgi:hypothetical protein
MSFDTNNNPILTGGQLLITVITFKWGSISGQDLLQIVAAAGTCLIAINQLILIAINIRKFFKKEK